MQLKSQIALVQAIVSGYSGGVVRIEWRAELVSGHSYKGSDFESVKSWAMANTTDDDRINVENQFWLSKLCICEPVAPLTVGKFSEPLLEGSFEYKRQPDGALLQVPTDTDRYYVDGIFVLDKQRPDMCVYFTSCCNAVQACAWLNSGKLDYKWKTKTAAGYTEPGTTPADRTA